MGLVDRLFGRFHRGGFTKAGCIGANEVPAALSPGMVRYVVAPGEDLKPFDLVGIDPATGKLRKVAPQDSGRKFNVPPGSRVTGDGYLEMPFNPPPVYLRKE